MIVNDCQRLLKIALAIFIIRQCISAFSDITSCFHHLTKWQSCSTSELMDDCQWLLWLQSAFSPLTVIRSSSASTSTSTRGTAWVTTSLYITSWGWTVRSRVCQFLNYQSESVSGTIDYSHSNRHDSLILVMLSLLNKDHHSSNGWNLCRRCTLFH